MHIRCLLLVSVFILSACEGSSSGASGKSGSKVGTDTVQTGNFEHLRIQGLGYRTDSQQGITDEQGSFRFSAGEEITFYLGNQQIATVEANTHIALIEHLAPAMPDNAGAILAEVNSLETSEFDTLINVLHALLRLDEAEHNNALIVLPNDLTITENLLEALPTPMQNFTDLDAIAALIRTQGNSLTLSYLDVIMWLYQLLQKDIASERTEQVNISAADGSLTITEYRHNNTGLINRSVRYPENNPTDTLVTDFFWNGMQQIQKIETAGNITEFTYDAEGNPIEITHDSDGSSSRDIYTYSEDGRLQTRRLDTNGLTTLERYTYSTEPHYQQVDFYSPYIEGSDAPTRSERHYFDDRELLTRKESDPTGAGNYNAHIDYEYDAFHRLINIKQEHLEESRQYNDIGLLAAKAYRNPNMPQLLSQTLYHYDDEGRLVSVTQQQYDQSGTLTRETQSHYSYFGTLLENGLYNLLHRPESMLPTR